MENVFVLKKVVSLHRIYIKQEEAMNANTLELEARKAELAREILGETDKNKVLEWMLYLRSTKKKAGKFSGLLWEGLNDAAKDVRLHQQGQLHLKTAQELLDEL
jgi:hypothetical protein